MLEKVFISHHIIMHLIILGGNSVSNKEWAKELVKAGRIKGYDADYIEYEHRKEGGPSAMSFPKEIEKLQARVEEVQGEKYAIIAKSAGTNLFFQTIESLENKPQFAVLCGIPLKVVTNSKFDADVMDHIVDFSVTVLQNKTDPVGPYGAIHHNLKTTKRTLKETDCKGHYYDVDVVMEQLPERK